MLKGLIDSLPAARDNIQQAKRDHDHKTLLEQVHKFHGVCCYVGVPKMRQLAHDLETALKAGNGSDAEQLLPQFLAEMTRIEQAAAEFMPTATI
jgi:two-component system sensor histidine kinase BarA